MEMLSIGLGRVKPRADGRAVRSATHVTPADLEPLPKVPFEPAAQVSDIQVQIK
jgi:hypothetical protein